MRLNRRVQNGTHGGVRGQLLNEWVTGNSISFLRSSNRKQVIFYMIKGGGPVSKPSLRLS